MCSLTRLSCLEFLSNFFNLTIFWKKKASGCFWYKNVIKFILGKSEKPRGKSTVFCVFASNFVGYLFKKILECSTFLKVHSEKHSNGTCHCVQRSTAALRGRGDLSICFSIATKNHISLEFSILRSGYIKRGKIEVSYVYFTFFKARGKMWKIWGLKNTNIFFQSPLCYTIQRKIYKKNPQIF